VYRPSGVHRDVAGAGLQGRHEADQKPAHHLVAVDLDAEQHAGRRQARQHARGHRKERRRLQLGQRAQNRVQRRHHE
jgi:hypothetical protein